MSENTDKIIGQGMVKNSDIKETAMGIALEFFDYPLFPGEAKDNFLSTRDLIAFGIKLLLKKSNIPCEENGLFVKEQAEDVATTPEGEDQ
jgi:hypothetical protein